MDSTLMDVLNHIPLGTFIACIIGICGLGITIFHAVKKYNKAITEHANKEREQTELSGSVTKLVSTVEELNTRIDNLANTQDEKRERTNKRLDELFESIEKTREENKKSDKILQEQLDKNEKTMMELSNQVEVIDNKTNLLIESDKEGIKTTISNEYYRAIKQGYIEIYILQSLEAIYEKYLQENGNTFIGGLMSELRELPHQQPVKKTRTSSKKKSLNIDELDEE